MTTPAFNEIDHPRSAAGKFTTKSHTESAVALAPPEVSKHPDWDEAVASIVASGKTTGEAKVLLGGALTAGFATSYLDSVKSNVDAGREVSAAMYAFAYGSLRDVPKAFLNAEKDPEGLGKALGDARNRIRIHNDLFGGLSHTGKEPILQAADEFLADMQEFLEN
ncbi:hypothetical protein [Arthrobacter sp. A2-55]|uniref:hypothetical protein n=1 Tax=Arthrobacter sp. A2-55 TaxID=2897337 RepID=UPI0021CDCEEB|nr:hypothetical protein [Arthrobacter sp. A2-55]MCU6480170.1 hypothetical protein [Arthrobacter sp. A2-55]